MSLPEANVLVRSRIMPVASKIFGHHNYWSKTTNVYSISKFFNICSGHLAQNTEIQDFFQVLKNKFGIKIKTFSRFQDWV
jgi:hypothetical protein